MKLKNKNIQYENDPDFQMSKYERSPGLLY